MSRVHGARRARALTVRELRAAIAGCPDDAEVDFGTTISGARLRWFRFTKKEKVFQVELIEDIGDEFAKDGHCHQRFA